MRLVSSAVKEQHQPGVPFMPLARHHAALKHELRSAFDRVVRESSFILGQEVERFEVEFAESCGVKKCVGVSSGTAALTLLLQANGIGPGDEVIVPAHTFIASALAVAHVGAVPVPCDVLEDSGLIDPDAARALVGPRTSAVLGVHLYGQPFDVAAIEAFARPAGLLVLEDAAQAQGARYRGQVVGSLGAGAAFSFYPTKNLGALGDAGAVCTNDESVAARVRKLRDLGQESKGVHEILGFNARLDGLQAAMLRVKLPHLAAWNAVRRGHASRYRAFLPPELGLLPHSSRDQCVYHIFPVRLEGRDKLRRALQARGIETGIHYDTTVPAHLAWKGAPLPQTSNPRADQWVATELSLPMHAYLDEREIDKVVDAIAAELGQSTKRHASASRQLTS
jgi:dTDP-4-amino-4,6-dideoxygalactose transaminase